MKKNLYQENINFVALFFTQIVVLNAGRRRLGVSDLRGKVHFLILAYEQVINIFFLIKKLVRNFDKKS